MKKLILSLITVSTLMTQTSSVSAGNPAIDTLMKTYQSLGAESGNATRGEIFWNKSFPGNAPYPERSCKTCHTADLKNKGKHIRTGKIIQPLSQSVNSKSMTDIKNIEKWFKRNCKWTTGHECSVQEKADILTFMQQQ